MRTRAIVNPRAAGRRTGRAWEDVAKLIASEIGAFETVVTDAPGAATRLTREALEDGVEQVLAVGGDGTTNEVVNGFFSDGRPINADAVLALMMLGTGGDFRKSLGIAAGATAFVQRLAEGSVRSIDLGQLEFVDHEGKPASRWFDNIASFGLSGAVVQAVNRARWTKFLGGKFAFKWASFVALLGHDNPMVRIEIDTDYVREIPATLVAACNGQFFGGGMWIAPEAQLDDGLLDVVALQGLGTLDFLRRGGAIYRGEHLALDNVECRRGRRLVATPLTDAPVFLDVDGEAPGRLPATFQIVPNALNVRC